MLKIVVHSAEPYMQKPLSDSGVVDPESPTGSSCIGATVEWLAETS
jgi:hypothetical protein